MICNVYYRTKQLRPDRIWNNDEPVNSTKGVRHIWWKKGTYFPEHYLSESRWYYKWKITNSNGKMNQDWKSRMHRLNKQYIDQKYTCNIKGLTSRNLEKYAPLYTINSRFKSCRHSYRYNVCSLLFRTNCKFYV